MEQPPKIIRSATNNIYVIGKTEDISNFYDLGEMLGQPGQFGRAVLATSKKTGQKFACKIISKARFAKNESGLEQFKTEIEIMQSLGHPNIIRFTDVYEDKANVYIIMEVCSGGEMFDRISAHGAYSEKDAARNLREICSALKHMHDHHIAHCDLKPDNFLYLTKEKDSPIKVIDFGLAKFRKNREYFHRFCGTPYYIAPEVLHGRYTESCDMWSLGVVMFVMLFGYPPFHADPQKYGKQADFKIYELIKKGFEPVVKKGYGAHFPATLPISDSAKDLVAKLIVSDSAKRLTAEEALNHPWLKGETASATPLDSLVLKGLSTFEKQYKFKNAMLRLMADTLSQDEISTLKDNFQSMDTDRSGTITIEELKITLSKLYKERAAAVGQEYDAKEANEAATRIMKTVDVDGDGSISYEELVMSYTNRKLNAKEERLYAAFCAMDLNGDGKISVEEMETVLSKHNLISNKAELHQMVKEADKDGNGLIDYEEFLTIMWDHNRSETNE